MDSKSLYNRAIKVLPGGVNSPVRAFNAVGGNPRFIDRADGAYIYDVDGNKYIDYIGSWGPMILGHKNKRIINAVNEQIEKGISFGAATEIEVDMAELITKIVPNVDMIRMVNSGTEAVMSAIRLARGYTKKDKIIKFAGCYHGHADSLLVKAGSGALTNGSPNSLGVTQATAKDTLIAEFNNIESVENIFNSNKNEIAAIIVEPVAANMGVVIPENDFLNKLRNLCDKNDCLLIFDEVITGFRLALGGAQEYFNVDADLITYGKIIGGGFPVGAYGGKKDIMKNVSPLGDVYQAGTLSGNPIGMRAGFEMLSELKENPEIYTYINQTAKDFADKIKGITKNTVNQIGSILSIFMTEEKVFDYNSAIKSDTDKYSQYFNNMLNRGIYIAPAQFEAMFISYAHTKEDIDFTLTQIKESLIF